MAPDAAALPVDEDTPVGEDERSRARRWVVLLGCTFATGFAGARLIDATPDGRLVSLLMLCVVGACAWTALFHPNLTPALLISYLPFNLTFPFQVSSGLNGSNLVLATGLLALVISRLRRPGRSLLIGLEVLVLLYLLIGALGAVRGALAVGGIDVPDLLITYRAWAAPILLFLIARGVIEEIGDAEAFLAVLGWGLFLIAFLTWREGVELSGRRSIEQQRVPGILRQPNSMGAFLAYYASSLLAVAAAKGPRLRRLVALVACLVAARAVIFTYSRGALLALGAGAATVAGFVSPLGLGVTGGTAMIMQSYPEMIPESIRARFSQTTHGNTEIYDESVESQLDKSSAMRLNLWRGGVEMVRQNPLTGVGLYRFGRVVGHYAPQEIGPDEPRDAHNTYILMAAELGLPGLIALVTTFMWIGAAAVSSRLFGQHSSERMLGLACLGSLAAVLTSCMFGSRLSDEALVGGFWMLAGLLFGVRALPPDHDFGEVDVEEM